MESWEQENDTGQRNVAEMEFIIQEGGGRQRTRVLPVTSVGWEPFQWATPAIRLQLQTADPDVLVSAVIRARSAGFVINAPGDGGVEHSCRTLAEAVLVAESLLIGELEKRAAQRVRQAWDAEEFPRLYEEAARAMGAYAGTLGLRRPD